MAFSDPIKPKFDNSTETECPRVSTGSFQSQYQSEDGLKKVQISTIETKKSRRRHSLRLDLSKLTTDPFDTTQNIEVGASAYVVIDRPISGFSNEELKKLTEGLCALLTASSGASIKKLVASES
jgi:hypothetical protein